MQALAGFGSRETIPLAVSHRPEVFWDALFHGRARMTDVPFHIVATFCIQEIVYGTSLRLATEWTRSFETRIWRVASVLPPCKDSNDTV